MSSSSSSAGSSGTIVGGSFSVIAIVETTAADVVKNFAFALRSSGPNGYSKYDTRRRAADFWLRFTNNIAPFTAEPSARPPVRRSAAGRCDNDGEITRAAAGGGGLGLATLRTPSALPTSSGRSPAVRRPVTFSRRPRPSVTIVLFLDEYVPLVTSTFAVRLVWVFVYFVPSSDRFSRTERTDYLRTSVSYGFRPSDRRPNVDRNGWKRRTRIVVLRWRPPRLRFRFLSTFPAFDCAFSLAWKY